ncbi:alpha-amylase family glycosyl hydrolase [Bacillus tuaregi]|uniref:alpha-amylase family glycosyl hydrolase n=1 Tax=Bacillus tuaregi TaxID=1816695 RepID=UPI0008F8D1EF|nr:alpha-amylase family glycosyl hydrolase [Bacillus tuaregi]
MKKWVLKLIIISLCLINVLPVAATEKESRSWQDESVYLMMIDRFNNGDQSNDEGVKMNQPEAYHGGDFQGVMDQLDYIKDMGFTAISLTPAFDNVDGGYHGYWVNDFYKTDEHFGSIEEFKKLINEAHKRDMKVILEFEVNHVGPNHAWLNDSKKNLWFRAEQGQGENLPLLDQENNEVQKYLIDAAKWWIKETNIDGYQVQLLKHTSAAFIRSFAKEVKAVKDNFYLLGEAKNADTEQMVSFIENGGDGITDYPLAAELREIFSKSNQSFTPLFARLAQNETVYPETALLATLMDNQFTERFTSQMVENNEHPGPRWRQALTFLYTTPGVPFVYYGSEIALNGSGEPDNRKQMNFRTDQEIVEYIKQLGSLRSELPSLTRGTMNVLYEKDGMAVYKRVYHDETTVVAINNTTETQTITLSEKELAGDKELRGLINNDLVRNDGEEYHITIDRDESELYVLRDKSGINYSYFIALGVVLVAFFVFISLIKKRSRK